jgi:glycyl-tRNA synthetase (class II)
MAENKMLTMEKLGALCKNRGIIYAGSEIYGGTLPTLGITVLWR